MTWHALRLHARLVQRCFMAVPSFCKRCGRTVHDYAAPDDVWRRVRPHIKHGDVLCYDCFCDVCQRAGLPAVWRLVSLEEQPCRD